MFMRDSKKVASIQSTGSSLQVIEVGREDSMVIVPQMKLKIGPDLIFIITPDGEDHIHVEPTFATSRKHTVEGAMELWSQYWDSEGDIPD